MRLGQRIVKARKAAGLRQVDLARKLGMKRSTLCSWEHGTHAPRTLQRLSELAKALGVRVAELVP